MFQNKGERGVKREENVWPCRLIECFQSSLVFMDALCKNRGRDTERGYAPTACPILCERYGILDWIIHASQFCLVSKILCSYQKECIVRSY